MEAREIDFVSLYEGKPGLPKTNERPVSKRKPAPRFRIVMGSGNWYLAAAVLPALLSLLLACK